MENPLKRISWCDIAFMNLDGSQKILICILEEGFTFFYDEKNSPIFNQFKEVLSNR